ncbi:sigma-70 family RNA polymerase sigma factor [Bacillus sp. BRMEA1]|uniref:sigma-70 family RNA polymerase sigma factor n=1 Tax=Neobacillus endophyticus TaxID=2738405 RepID=UPI0015671EA6|nr:sigma-70 family RNA polymerase sigma factor [Neobacillus endophyticus]NRD76928.1 sigma-70 family RNA polymerase sigma factor [Neobacillus endophyticus]
MESFEQLVKQYEPMMNVILHSLNIYRNKDEFYQICLIALWEASQRFNPEKGDFTNYAYTSIKGQCLSEIRKITRREEKCLNPDEEFWSLMEDTSPTQPLLVEVLPSRLEGLTVNQRKWLYYTVQHGLSVKEIAEKEHASTSAVKQWRLGARNKLKALRD